MHIRLLQPRRLDVWRTDIPMRAFEHAAAARRRAEAVVTRLELADGRTAWGETLPRPYVTGESIESVVADLAERLWPALRRACDAGADLARPDDRLAAIPHTDDDGRCLCAAACALELPVAALAAPVRPGRQGRHQLRRVRVSGVLGSTDPARTAGRLRLLRWLGLRHFKLKLGFGADVDAANLRVVRRQLARALRRGRCTLRVDVNGGWAAAETPQRLAELAALGVCAVEQPVFASAAALAELAGRCTLPLIADECLRTEADAAALEPAGERVWWNVRISKNGGLAGARRLAQRARAGGIPLVLGCMVGETSILSGAQRRLLATLPEAPAFVEGNYGRLLLRGDLTRRSLGLGWGGRLRRPGAPFAPPVDPRRLRRYGVRVRSVSV